MLALAKSKLRKLVDRPVRNARRAWTTRSYTRRRRCGAWAGRLYAYPANLVNSVEDDVLELLGYPFDLTTANVWGLSPNNGYHWPRRYREEYELAAPEAGDYKLVWELGRLQFLPALLAADPQHGVATLESYLDYDQPLRTIHWCSEMEIGIRMISLMLLTPLLGEDSPLRRRVIESVNVHYHYLRDHLTTWWPVRNNHVLVEVTALLVYEMLFAGDHPRHAEHWRILLREAHDQIYHDGGIREQSTGYARFNLDAFCLLWVLGDLVDADTPAWLKRLVENMLEYLCDLRQPNGRWPQIGDADDGRVVPPASDRDIWDFGGHLALGAVLCNRPDFKAAAGRWDNDFAWFIGADYARRFDALDAGKLIASGQFYRQSGYWVWRSADGADADYLLLRAGEFGLGGEGVAPHSHCDELSITASLAGRPLLVDGGTYTYDPRDDDWRWRFRGNDSHNILTVNGWSQAERREGSNFLWGRIPTATIIEAADDHVIAVLDDYENRYGWTRRVDVEVGRVMITDEVRLSADGGDVRWCFNFAPGVDVNPSADGAALRNGDHCCRMVATGLPPGARWRVEQGWYSERYNRREPIARLVIETPIQGQCEVQWTIECAS